MKVLLIATNIFEAIGGGETVYGRIISANPGTEFYYYVTSENRKNANRPSNAHVVQLQVQQKIEIKGNPLFPKFEMDALTLANQYAKSVAGEEFDIVDIPDYYSFGSYLKSAFAHHDVKVKKVVLAMHGNLSTSIKLNWDTMDLSTDSTELLERRQFIEADGVYAISEQYIEEWQAIYKRDVYYIDPINFVNIGPNLKKTIGMEDGEKVKLCCIGRMERRKGNDIFLDIVRWVDQKLYGKAMHVGGEYYFNNGTPSSYHLDNLAKHRDISVEYVGSYNRDQLNELYASRAFVIIPTRYDTLNLVALEALFSGCPVAVSTKAGVCKFLDENYPQIPYVKIDFDNFAAAIDDIESVLCNYDKCREDLAEAISEINFAELLSENEIVNIYSNIISQTQSERNNIISYEERNTICVTAKNLAKALGFRKARDFLKSAPYKIRELAKTIYRKTSRISNIDVFANAYDSKNIRNRDKRIASLGESSLVEKIAKLNSTYELCNNRVFRCNGYEEIARQQRNLGFNLHAATYELRLLRLTHQQHNVPFEDTIDTLNKEGYGEEARVAELLYSDRDEKKIFEYLKGSYEKWQTLPRKDENEVFEDYRKGNARVCVIVSLYNAADKLNFFVSMLIKQTISRKGDMEVIFVDSCSPMDEYSELKKYIGKLNFLYIKSKKRETIQKAWNRALQYTNAEYITFLGVDEMMYPTSLEVLMDTLDSEPNIDWVVGNSLIANVEMNGILKNDAFLYIRRGAERHSVNLETCYMTYVGGLYRRNIHERFGYYDEDFRGAGDTEFKNRILPRIQVKYIDKMLGVFLDYPQERMTASPLAEIEDLRAWYIYRTLGGVRYEYELASIKEIEEALVLSLKYRKSYNNYNSTDFEYANCLVSYLLERDPNNTLALKLKKGIRVLLDDMVQLEYLDHLPKKREGYFMILRVWRHAKLYEREHGKVLKNYKLEYNIVNDNRYEQHSWLWKPEVKEI